MKNSKTLFEKTLSIIPILLIVSLIGAYSVFFFSLCNLQEKSLEAISNIFVNFSSIAVGFVMTLITLTRALPENRTANVYKAQGKMGLYLSLLFSVLLLSILLLLAGILIQTIQKIWIVYIGALCFLFVLIFLVASTKTIIALILSE